MITTVLKQKILIAVLAARENFTGSDAKFAISIGVNNAQYSRIKNGDFEKVLSDPAWITLARKFNVSISNAPAWNIAKTAVFQSITAQMEVCQQQCISTMLCDVADAGKTVAAKYYASTHKNVVYIDCSQVKSKQKFIRQIAKSFGVDSNGRYADVYEDLVFYLKTLSTPLIILDEAGDLNYDAFLEIKALWNAVEMICSFYMIGADGLREKVRRAINNKKVGYAEIFRRFGNKYVSIVPSGEVKSQFMNSEAMLIIKANAPEGANLKQILNRIKGEDQLPSLTRIRTELAKLTPQASPLPLSQGEGKERETNVYNDKEVG